MRRMLLVFAVMAVMAAMLAVMAVPASAHGSGTQPGLEPAHDNTSCSGAGAAGAGGDKGSDHDLSGGADGELTGLNNSGLCSSREA